MTSASSGRVLTAVRQSGMTELTKRVTLSRTWGTAIVIGPSAVAILAGAVAVAGAASLRRALEASAPQETLDLLLYRPLEHELGTEPPKPGQPVDRVGSLVGI
jgi:hypothetical protein